ncbi:GntR family transcriptional regulator [Prauserella marina]|uniref:DNA-binding transcriptional regulator, FadR family n=1 Tax=Prauserella marina TaxID=530584 RepID=A0A222W023_9PSEU|nr:FCD domain-containing protein [Prauserella marina]ASR39548.1 GntR family transcriptional regulator [Prauserella marina]PWV72594.1 DNA-binding FadR family transcriptional regulator [Prauserella marina]SDD76399.1 DNA-binding transcriptional regulator, FadR family [Prauserella marina]
MPPFVQRRPLTSLTADALLDDIRSGRWPLGQRLPGEATLAAQLGVGRSTLREAIRELAGKGVLDSRQGAGVFVIATDVTEDWDAVLRRASVGSVIEARMAIETEAAALAAERRTPADLRTINRALGARRWCDRDLADHVDADMVFHRTVLVAAHNDVLTELFDSFVPRVRKAMVDMLRIRPLDSPDDDHTAHALLATAIADRDPVAAAEASRTHLTDLKRQFT